jgi:hypothetical protein
LTSGAQYDAKMAALEAKLPQSAGASYDRLRQALEGFIEVHADGEVDQAGSGRAGFVIREQDAVRDQFVIELETLLSGEWPVASATAARDADAHLNASYRKTLASAASSENMSTIHADAIHSSLARPICAMHSWIGCRYRGRWIHRLAATRQLFEWVGSDQQSRRHLKYRAATPIERHAGSTMVRLPRTHSSSRSLQE